jgi:hypothetical protein
MGRERYASDYFQQLYDWAVKMIKDGKAYIDSQSSEDMAKQKEHHSLVLMDLTVIVLLKRILLYLKE